MSRDVLDLIDNVVAEQELLSADAMRWAPDAPDPTPPPGGAFQVRCDDAPRDITAHAAPWLPERLRALYDDQRQVIAALSRTDRED